MSSIFHRSHPDIEKWFDSAPSPDKVILVPIDYAKSTHVALCSDGRGKSLKAAFPVHNSPEGVDYLLNAVEGLCRKHRIDQRQVLFAGEDGGSFSDNFIHALRQKNFPVVGVNPRDAAEERKGLPASTDVIDLQGILSLLLKRQGRLIPATAYGPRQLRRLTHQRLALVKARSACKHRIHRLVDGLFPGFLNDRLSGILPFGRASCWLMSRKFSATQILRRSRPALIKKFQQFSLRHPDKTLEKLRAYARTVLLPPPEMVEPLQISLESEIQTLEQLNRSIRELEGCIARFLAQTPGAFFTTVRGIGVTLAAELYAELADPARKRSFKRMSSYAGLAPKLKQTGGPEGKVKVGHRHRRCNHVLKKAIVQAGLSVGQHGPEELMRDYNRREINGQDARIGMARKVLSICLGILNNPTGYSPKSLIDNGTPEQIKDYFLKSWRPLLIKWRDAPAIRQAFAPGAPLDQWRCVLEELYQIDLPVDSPQHRE